MKEGDKLKLVLTNGYIYNGTIISIGSEEIVLRDRNLREICIKKVAIMATEGIQYEV